LLVEAAVFCNKVLLQIVCRGTIGIACVPEFRSLNRAIGIQ
jgi:hypothetical protein